MFVSKALRSDVFTITVNMKEENLGMFVASILENTLTFHGDLINPLRYESRKNKYK